MKRPFLLLSLLALYLANFAQSYSSTSIFAHNDYLHPDPFHESYSFQVGFIEVDIFLEDQALLVAHTKKEIDPIRTLHNLYLRPLDSVITANHGFAYADTTAMLTLMIDLKSDGLSTVHALALELERFPDLIRCPTLTIAISGNVPHPDHWTSVPPFIFFDGRPQMNYTEAQLRRVVLVSDNFRKYARWNGTGALSDAERNQILSVKDKVKKWNKPVRFWATADNEAVWSALIEMNIDVLGTDDVRRLNDFIEHR